MRPDVLVLGAFDPEVAPLRSILGSELSATISGQTIVARTVGIGLPAAAAGAAFLIAEFDPRSVVLVGTCGAFATAGLSIGDVVVARRLLLVDRTALDELSQFPAPMTIDIETSSAIREALAACEGANTDRRRESRAVCVATTIAITVDDGAADRVARATGADVEHLEIYGVAAACALRRVPFGAVLGVANSVGAHGRAEWRAHHGEAEAAAAERVMRWLRPGAVPREAPSRRG